MYDDVSRSFQNKHRTHCYISYKHLPLMSTDNASQRINKRKRSGADAAKSECKKYNVQRRASSSRHELHRQLNPTPVAVSNYLIEKKHKLLMKLQGCVYCGQPATTMDHFEPLVTKGMPTGLIPTELDVVPCCAWCNSSKGSRPWRSAHAESI